MQTLFHHLRDATIIDDGEKCVASAWRRHKRGGPPREDILEYVCREGLHVKRLRGSKYTHEGCVFMLNHRDQADYNATTVVMTADRWVVDEETQGAVATQVDWVTKIKAVFGEVPNKITIASSKPPMAASRPSAGIGVTSESSLPASSLLPLPGVGDKPASDQIMLFRWKCATCRGTPELEEIEKKTLPDLSSLSCYGCNLAKEITIGARFNFNSPISFLTVFEAAHSVHEVCGTYNALESNCFAFASWVLGILKLRYGANVVYSEEGLLGTAASGLIVLTYDRSPAFVDVMNNALAHLEEKFKVSSQFVLM